VAILVRLPESILAQVRQIAADEERPLNTQVLRFIRSGLEQYQADHEQGQRKQSVSAAEPSGDLERYLELLNERGLDITEEPASYGISRQAAGKILKSVITTLADGGWHGQGDLFGAYDRAQVHPGPELRKEAAQVAGFKRRSLADMIRVGELVLATWAAEALGAESRGRKNSQEYRVARSE